MSKPYNREQFENLKRTLKEIAEKTYEGLLLKRQKQLRAVDEASNEYKRLAGLVTNSIFCQFAF